MLGVVVSWVSSSRHLEYFLRLLLVDKNVIYKNEGLITFLLGRTLETDRQTDRLVNRFNNGQIRES
jgi:hypothetical protein